MEPFLRELLVCEDGEPRAAAMNMAVDEAILRAAERPTLRFYRWRRAALSFGYFGRFADVAEATAEREPVRRWTGGGIVLHGEDLTYSLVLPRAGNATLPAPQAVYRQVHEAIRKTLAHHAPVTLAGGDAPKLSEACFANAVTADVLCRGRKIAGAAQRRTRAGLLQQGSIQFEGLPAGFGQAFAAALAECWETCQLDDQVLSTAENLSAVKYGTAGWLHLH